MHGVKFGTRWSIPFAGFLLALMGGISYAWGVFVVPMKEEFGWTTTEATLPLSAFMVTFALMMVPAGMIQDIIGPRKVSLLGASLFLVAYTLASLVELFPYSWWLVLSYGVLGGIACGLTYSCVAPPARKWFPDKPGLAISYAVMGFGLAAVIFAPLKANYLIPEYGIGGTFLIIGVLIATISTFASWLIINPPKDWIPFGFINRTEALFTKENATAKEVISSPKFKILWLIFMCVSAGGLMVIGLIPTYGVEILGLTKTQAALSISIFAAVNGFGRPIAGYLSDKFGVLWVMIVTYTIQSITYLSFPLLVTSLPMLYIGSALLGWGYAVTLALFPTLTSLYFGTKNMGVNYGLVFTAFGVGALSPVLSSIIYDVTKSYTFIFILVGILAGIGQVLSIYQKRKYQAV
jgi:MFS transporter, OFA family, oxalate/formate antiporter